MKKPASSPPRKLVLRREAIALLARTELHLVATAAPPEGSGPVCKSIGGDWCPTQP